MARPIPGVRVERGPRRREDARLPDGMGRDGTGEEGRPGWCRRDVSPQPGRRWEMKGLADSVDGGGGAPPRRPPGDWQRPEPSLDSIHPDQLALSLGPSILAGRGAPLQSGSAWRGAQRLGRRGEGAPGRVGLEPWERVGPDGGGALGWGWGWGGGEARPQGAVGPVSSGHRPFPNAGPSSSEPPAAVSLASASLRVSG